MGKQKASNYNNTKKDRNASRKNQGYSKRHISDASADFRNPGVNTVSAHNDYEWYVVNEELAKNVSSIGFGNYAGGLLKTGASLISQDEIPSTDASASIGTPGIITFSYKPGCGPSTNSESAINLAARNMWSYVFAKQTYTTKFQPNDLVIYLTAMSSAYGMLAYFQKAYGLLRLYSQQNTYMPRGILTAMGLDFEDLQSHILDFRARINLFAIQLGARYIPARLPIVARANFMATGLFRDQEDENFGKYQIYQTVPEGFYTYNHKKYTTGGCAEYHHWWYPGMPVKSYQDCVSVMDNIVKSIAYDTDIDNICGVLQKAFGDENGLHAPMIGEDFTVKPTYDKEVIYQLTNAVCLGRPGRVSLTFTDVDEVFSSDDIFQRPDGKIYYVPTVSGDVMHTPRRPVLNFAEANPTVRMVTLGTRLISAGGEIVDGEGMSFNYEKNTWEWYGLSCTYNFTCGFEHLVGFSVLNSRVDSNGDRKYAYLDWGYGPTTSSFPVLRWDTNDGGAYSTNISFMTGVLENLCLVSNFDWHPRLYPIFIHKEQGQDDYAGTSLTTLGDLHTYTTITSDKLDQINRICMQGLFKVPELGVWNP